MISEPPAAPGSLERQRLPEDSPFRGYAVRGIVGSEHVSTHVDSVWHFNPDRPDLPPYGAGEAVCKPLIAAVANAIYDATGVRLRRVPFRDERVLAELKSAGV